MTVFVRIKFDETGAEGKCPVDAVPLWEAKGYSVVDDAELEQAQEEQDAAPFDPADGSAKRVYEYLTGIDRATPEGQTEYDRVVSAEQNGQNRTTAFPA